MASRAAVPHLVTLMIVVSSAGVGLAAWQPDAGDWTHFRRSADHQGLAAAPGAFSLAVADLRVRWQVTTAPGDPGYWIPPVAADLNNDGVAEVVAPIGNASANPSNPSNPVALESGFEVRNGATGALLWSYGPTSGNLVFFGPTLGDLNGDANGDIVFMDGNPLTGTSATNKIHAYTHAGVKLWEWSDATWTKTPEPLNALAIGDVDGDGKNEVVANILLTNVVTTVAGGKVVINGNNPEHRVVALNGENGLPSWQRTFPNGSVSSPAIADLNGDGMKDVVFGSGARPGAVIVTDSAVVSVSNDFADDKLRVIDGASPPNLLWEHAATGFFPGDIATAPVVADLGLGNGPNVVQNLWVRNIPALPTDTTTLRALTSTGAIAWDAAIAASSPAPPAAADLNGDGKPDVVLQTDHGDASARYRVHAVRNDGVPLWSSASLLRTLSSAPAVGDLTGDGLPEIVVVGARNASLGLNPTLYVLSGQTGALLMAYDLAGTVDSLGGPVLADLDGDDDGRMEILVNIGAWNQPGRLLALEPHLPDLTITGLLTGTAPRVVGEGQTLSATVNNVGTRTASGAVVRFTENGAPIPGAEFTVTLAPGASQLLSAPWTPGTSGNRVLAAVADPGKAIPEDKENNNAQQATVYVTHRPVCGFGFAPAAPTDGAAVQFTDLTTDADDGSAATFLWTFGDGGPSSALKNPSRKFPDGGSYTVTLQAADAHGAGCSTSQVLSIGHASPVPGFTAKPSGGLNVQFTDTSTHPNANDAPPAGWSYLWDFGHDGATSTERNPLHTFPTQDVYPITLTACDNDATCASVTVNVNLVNQAPKAAFSWSPTPAIAGQAVYFNAAPSTDADGTIVAWAWDINDDGVTDGTQSTIGWTYFKGGDYPVTLTVTDDQGATDTLTQSVHVCETGVRQTADGTLVIEVCTHIKI